jgi:(p)ppGpp synthase/HD superfamily hydrolase
MLRMDNDLERMAAVLHDVVEDSSWTLADLRKEGFPDPVIAAVNHLSRRENESYDDFIRRIRPQALAAKIKLADLEDNMNLTRLKQFTQQEKERVAKYHSAWLMIKKSPPGS